jgi:dihydroneopterin aldolase
VAQAVHAELAGEPVDLIETLAERIAARCLAFPGVQAVEISLHKPEAPVGVPASDVVLRIVRERE